LNINKIGIYCFINTHNGKRYVGQSINIDARHKRHLIDLNKNTHPNAHLQGAFNKYGSSCFELHILEECGADMLDMREIAWINYYHSYGEGGYNMNSGGLGNKRYVPSEETRRKLSEAAKRRPPMSDEIRRKISETKKGTVISAEHRRKLSEASKGRVTSAETRAKLSEYSKTRTYSAETRAKMSESAKRKPLDSEETKRKKGAASLARWSLKKSLTLQNN
jgi:group I intron endonuclease